MSNKNLVIFMLVAILIIAIIYKQYNKIGPQPKQVIEIVKSQETPANKVIDVITKAALKESEKTVTQEKIKPAIILEYDTDPVVNINMVLKNNMLCIRHLTNNNGYANYFNILMQKLDEKQIKYYDNFVRYCEEINKQHPEYHLTDDEYLYQQKRNIVATSQWGKILKGEINPTNLTATEMGELLKLNDINILSDAPKYLRKYYQEVIHWDLESVLQNHQYDYVELIESYAHQLYLCQQGADCSVNSSIMSMLCYLNAAGCGLTYPQYTQQVLTQGQNADIQLALAYLTTQYQ